MFDADMSLDEIAQALERMTPEERAEVLTEAERVTGKVPWIPNPGPQTSAYYCEADELFYGGQAGGGKPISIHEKIPTVKGWVTMGEIQVGDEIFDETGKVCRVTALSEVHTPVAYRLTFDDKTTILAGEDHQWLTFDAKELDALIRTSEEWKARRRANRPSRAKGTKSAKFTASLAARNSANAKGGPPPEGTIRTTREIAQTLRARHDNRRNHAIPVAGALELPDADLLVPPYVLGAWLGDGSKNGGGLTGVDPEIWERIEAEGYVVAHGTQKKAHHIRGLVGQLRDLGVLNNKHIPQQYLRGSKAQRLALLQGLMDTDGHAALDGGCEFDNTNKTIIDGVYELVTSLGIKATVQEGKAKLNGRVVGPRWRVKFVTTEPAFYLPRKAARMRGWVRQTAKFRYITNAEIVDSVPMRCIAVDSPRRLYLCGPQMVPTHNSALVIGLSLTQHKRSLILRRTNKEARGLVDEIAEVLGGREGYNGQDDVWRLPDGRMIEIGGCQMEEDKQKYKGRGHDLKSFDEVSDFTQSQYEFIIGWNRSPDPNQRCRVVATGNPPTTPEGLWVLKRWAAWLDPTHPNPAHPGELRWYTTGPDGREIEVDGPGPHDVGGEMIRARSRTFIPAKLSDNPFLMNTNYSATLAALPEELRAAYRDGRFDLGLKDRPFQAIPTAWVRAAQERWTKMPPNGEPMCSMGVDASGGGDDPMIIARRHDGWYDRIVEIEGKLIPMERAGSYCGGMVLSYRRDNALVVVDMGGGYGGPMFENLTGNGVQVRGYKGGEKGIGHTRDGNLSFANKRSAAIWRLREALDPDQPGGSRIMLPPDPALLADLTAPCYQVKGRVIHVEAKVDVVKRLGRSTDRGDAVVMAWTAGLKADNIQGGMPAFNHQRTPQVVMGRAAQRRR